MPLEPVTQNAIDEAATSMGTTHDQLHFAEEFKTGGEAEAVWADPQGALDYATSLTNAALYAMTVRASVLAEARDAAAAPVPVVEPGDAAGRVGERPDTLVEPGDSPVTGTGPESEAATEALIAANQPPEPVAAEPEEEETVANGDKSAKELRDGVGDMTDEELEELKNDDRVTVAAAAEAEIAKREEEG
jgi:hypothetical protein